MEKRVPEFGGRLQDMGLFGLIFPARML